MAGVSGMLSVVGTPIGNLDDASPRSIACLGAADVIYCEDTRVTARLLARHGLRVPLRRADEHMLERRVDDIVARVGQGAHVAFVSDAGMPCISDPGQRLVDAALDAGLPVEVVPGPTALTSAIARSGLHAERFFFEGFLPRKEGPALARLRELAAVPGALVFYESARRTPATLARIAQVLAGRRVALVRELTKVHEECVRDEATALAARIEGQAAEGPLRGECVIVVERSFRAACAGGGASAHAESTHAQGPDARDADVDASDMARPSLEDEIRAGLASGEPKPSLARRLARERGLARSDVYARILELG